MTFLKQNWFRVVIVLGVTTLVLTISYYSLSPYLSEYILGNTEEVIESPTPDTFNIELEERSDKFSSSIAEKIQNALPDGVFIRDFEQIPGRSGFLVVFVNFAKVERDQSKWSDCTYNYTQRLSGNYYIGYVYNGKLINAFQLTLPDQAEGVVFRRSVNEDNKSTEIPLIEFADYTGDRNPFEFKLLVGLSSCKHANYSIIGYDPDRHNVVVYSVLDEGVLTPYYDNFFPGLDGRVNYEFTCNDYEDIEPVYYFKKSFKFHQGLKRYELISNSEELC